MIIHQHTAVSNVKQSNDISRVICVNNKAEMLWSTEIEGKASGKPIISKFGRFVYVNHNVFDDVKNATVGHFTILDGENNGRVHFTEAVDVFPHARGEWGEWHVRRIDQYFGGSPYGPISMINPKDDRDILFFAENARDGYGSEGALHRVRVKKTGQVESIVVNVTHGYSASAAPLVAEDGKQVYLATAKSTLVGWMNVGRKGVEEKDQWKVQLDLSSRNKTTGMSRV